MSGATTWIISSPVNCSTEIIHNPPTPVAPPCGPFSFQDITLAEAGAVQLNSTAVATATRDISGSIIECLAGFISSLGVGSISLCVIGKFKCKCVRTTSSQNNIDLFFVLLQMSCLHQLTYSAWKYLVDCQYLGMWSLMEIVPVLGVLSSMKLQ